MRALICLLLALLLPAAALAEAPPVYIALGDSISAGYGLSANEASFPALLAREGGYTLINHAVNGNTVPGILRQLTDPAVLADVAQAEIITITCGGNDLMAVLYDCIAMVFNASVPAEAAIHPQEVTTILASSGDPRQGALMLATLIALEGHADMGVAPLMQSPEMAQALADYTENMSAVITILRDVNPDARILLATQYNPYRGFTGLYASINHAMDAGAQQLNSAICALPAVLDCEVADVYAAFSASPDDLMNASMAPLNLDFHPNAAGHTVLAECMLALLQGAE